MPTIGDLRASGASISASCYDRDLVAGFFIMLMYIIIQCFGTNFVNIVVHEKVRAPSHTCLTRAGTQRARWGQPSHFKLVRLL